MEDEAKLLQAVLCSRRAAATHAVFNREPKIVDHLLRRAIDCPRIRDTLVKCLQGDCSQQQQGDAHEVPVGEQNDSPSEETVYLKEFLDSLRVQLLRIRTVDLLKQDFLLSKEIVKLEALCRDVCARQGMLHVSGELWEAVRRTLTTTTPRAYTSSASSSRQVCSSLVEDAAIVSRARQVLETARPAADHMCHTITRDKCYGLCDYNRALDSGGVGSVHPPVRCTCLRGCHDIHFASKTRSMHSCCSVCKVNRRKLHPAVALEIDAADALPLLALAEAIGAAAVVDDCLLMIAAAKDAVIDACRLSFSSDTMGREVDWAVAVGRLARWPRKVKQTLSPRHSSISPPTNAPRIAREEAGDSGGMMLTMSRPEEGYDHCDKVTGGIQHVTVKESRADGVLDLPGRRKEPNGRDVLRVGRIDRALSSPTNSVRSNDLDVSGGIVGKGSRMTGVCWTNQSFLNGGTPNTGDELDKAMELAECKPTLDDKCQMTTIGTKSVHSQVLMRQSPPPPPSPPPTSPAPCPLGNDVGHQDITNVVESGDGRFEKIGVRTVPWQKPGIKETPADVSKGRERKQWAEGCMFARKPSFPGVSLTCTDAWSCCEVDAAVMDGIHVSITSKGRDDQRKQKCPHSSPLSSPSVKGGVRRSAFASMPTAGDEEDDANRTHHRCLSVPTGLLLKEENQVSSPGDGTVKGTTYNSSIGRVTSPGTTSAARPCDVDGQTAIDVMVGNIRRVSSKPRAPDVSAMLVVRENQHLCEQARKRALQRLRKARLQQGVKRAQATADKRELSAKRRLRRKQKFATMLDGRRRREGSFVKNCGAIDGGSWCEEAQPFADKKSVEGVHREESRPKSSVAFESAVKMETTVHFRDGSDRFAGDVGTNQPRLMMTLSEGSEVENAVVAPERHESGSDDEEETAREPLVITPVEPGLTRTSSGRKSPCATAFMGESGRRERASVEDDVRTGCTSSLQRFLEKGTTRGRHGPSHRANLRSTGRQTAAEMMEINGISTGKIFEGKPTHSAGRLKRCQSCARGRTCSPSRQVILRLDTLYALPGREQCFARRRKGRFGSALYFVLQVGQMRHQTVAHYPKIVRPTMWHRRQRGETDGNGGREGGDTCWTFGETVVLHLARPAVRGLVAPSLRIFAYSRSDDNRCHHSLQGQSSQATTRGSSVDTDGQEFLGSAAAEGTDGAEDILVGSASVRLKCNDGALHCADSRECTFRDVLEVPLLSVLEGVAIGWLMLGMCG